jgi:murein L,D-transpeptidase YafK
LRTLSATLSLAAAVLLASFAYALSNAPDKKAPVDFVSGAVSAGFSLGTPVMIRIFKRESQLEVWMLKDARFELFGAYPICYWSGKLGPKEREGDRQAPEGFYSVGIQQLHLVGRHPRSLNIGFPNAFDRASNRTGSSILVHGGCTSVGCFAMTDPVMEQIYTASEQALYAGQDKIQVQIFPFRMTEANLAAEAGNKWYGFWRNLKRVYDIFEATRTPPAVRVCRRDYAIAPEADGDLVAPEDCANEDPIMTSSVAAPKATHRPDKQRLLRLAHVRASRSAASRPGKPIGHPRPNRKTVAVGNNRMN